MPLDKTATQLTHRDGIFVNTSEIWSSGKHETKPWENVCLEKLSACGLVLLYVCIVRLYCMFKCWCWLVNLLLSSLGGFVFELTVLILQYLPIPNLIGDIVMKSRKLKNFRHIMYQKPALSGSFLCNIKPINVALTTLSHCVCTDWPCVCLDWLLIAKLF